MTNKTLTNLVLAGALTMGGAGCGCHLNSKYHFDGKIGDEQVTFFENISGCSNFLVIVKADGSNVVYQDHNDDFKLESMCRTKGNYTACTFADSNDPAENKTLQQAQKQFDAYLAKIIEVQTAPLRK